MGVLGDSRNLPKDVCTCIIYIYLLICLRTGRLMYLLLVPGSWCQILENANRLWYLESEYRRCMLSEQAWSQIAGHAKLLKGFDVRLWEMWTL